MFDHIAHLVASVVTMTITETRRPAPAEWTAFLQQRREQATARRGPASFVWGDFVTEPGQRVAEAPGRWSPLPHGQAGLSVEATAEDGIRIGGALVTGRAILHADEADGPALAEFPGGAEGVIFTYDGSKHALQVWNPQSDWARRFDTISAFDWDPDWVVEATVAEVPAGRTVVITHHRDPRPVEVPVVAEVTFAHDGREHRLVATPGGPDAQGLFLHFRDATNGSESYAAGRSIRFVPDGGRAVLDFNYAALLPCSFSLAWNCPLPPGENTLDIPVRAGERHALDHDGKPLL